MSNSINLKSTMRLTLCAAFLVSLSSAFVAPRSASIYSTGASSNSQLKFSPGDNNQSNKNSQDENFLHIPHRLGFTTASWKKQNNPDECLEAYDMMMEAGIELVDTSPQTGEELLSNRDLNRAMVAGTFSARFKLAAGKMAVADAAESSYQSQGHREGSKIMVYQMRPSRASLFMGLGTLADGAMEAMDDGCIICVGGVDMGKGKMNAFARALKKRDEELVSNQVSE